MYPAIILASIYFMLAYGEVMAASSDNPAVPAGGAGMLIPFAIAYLSRKRAIGGWLFFFYLQLYFSFVVSLLFIPQALENLKPSEWGDSLQYVMFFLSVVPVFILGLIELFVATLLLFRRTKHNVKLLRKVLIGMIVASGSAVWIDYSYFQDDPFIVFDVVSLLFAVIWLSYFYKARRVKLVFIDRNWTYTPYSERRNLTQDEKRKLRKRALISAIVVFVALLMMMGATLQQEGTEPDSGIFIVPVFYALLAALIAWYLPIQRKKKAL